MHHDMHLTQCDLMRYIDLLTMSSLVQITACCLSGARPSSGPMVTFCQLGSMEEISLNDNTVRPLWWWAHIGQTLDPAMAWSVLECMKSKCHMICGLSSFIYICMYTYMYILNGVGFYGHYIFYRLLSNLRIVSEFLLLNPPFGFCDFNHVLLWSVLFCITRVIYVLITKHALSEMTK